jgi:hypothetical protein
MLDGDRSIFGAIDQEIVRSPGLPPA